MKWQVKKILNKDIIDHLLQQREIEDKESYFNPKHPSSITTDELGIKKKDLNNSLSRIKKAIKNKEKIVVYGDYDVDGISATAIMWETLNSLGADALPYIPDRKSEGYGFSDKGVENILDKHDPKLVITVDHGITAGDKLNKLTENGVDVIITDHHAISSDKENEALKKSAHSVVHTDKLSGAGISWYVANNLVKEKDDEHLALAAMGTIADIVPLLGANRQIARYGLENLTKSQRTGLLALKKTGRNT